MVSKLGWLPITLIGMIIHGHGDKAFIQYSNELWPNDPNFMMKLFLHLFHSLEKELVRETVFSKLFVYFLSRGTYITGIESLPVLHNCCEHVNKCWMDAQIL